jgi:hypothetical protein
MGGGVVGLDPTSSKKKTNSIEELWKCTAGFKTENNFYNIFTKPRLNFQGARLPCGIFG